MTEEKTTEQMIAEFEAAGFKAGAFQAKTVKGPWWYASATRPNRYGREYGADGCTRDLAIKATYDKWKSNES